MIGPPSTAGPRCAGRVAACWPAAALGTLLGGCLYIPNLGRSPVDELDSMEVGATTRAEAKSRLGDPNLLQNPGFFVYLASSGGFGTIVFITLDGGGGLFPLGTEAVLFLLRFDSEGRLAGLETESGSLAGTHYGGDASGRVRAEARLPRTTILEGPHSFWKETFFQSVAFAPSGRFIVAGDTRDRVQVHTPATGESAVLDRGDFHQLRLSRDGTTLALVEKTVRLVDTSTWEARLDFEGHGRASFWSLKGAASLAFAPDDVTVATGGYQGEVKLWEAASGRELATHAAHDGQVTFMSYSPDGTLLATSGTDETTRLWRVSCWKEVGEIGTRGMPRFSPDGRTLALHRGLHVELWSIDSSSTPALGKLREVLLLPYFLPPWSYELYSSLAFSPDGRLLAASHGSVALWDVTTSQLLWRHDVEGEILDRGSGNDAVYDLAFSPDGRQLVTAGNDGVHLWDLSPVLPPTPAGFQRRSPAPAPADSGEPRAAGRTP